MKFGLDSFKVVVQMGQKSKDDGSLPFSGSNQAVREGIKGYLDNVSNRVSPNFELNEKIIQKLSNEGHLIGIDKDENAISLCKKRLNSSRFTKISLFNDSFVNAKTLLARIGVKEVNGFLLDLGMSSMQLDSPIRGFSFSSKSSNEKSSEGLAYARVKVHSVSSSFPVRVKT